MRDVSPAPLPRAIEAIPDTTRSGHGSPPMGGRLWPGGRLIVPVLPLAATLADALGAARRDGKPPEVPAPPEARGFS